MSRRDSVLLAARLLNSSMVAQVAVLAATLAAMPRLLPQDLADYGLVAGVATVLVTCSTLAVETRIAAVDTAAAQALLRSGLWASTGVLVVMLALAAVSSALDPHLALVLAFGAVCSWLLGFPQVLTSVVLRQQRQGALARSRVWQGLVNAVLILVMLLLPVGGFLILTVPWVASLVVSSVVLWRASDDVVRGMDWRPTRRDFALTGREVRWQSLANLLAGSVGSMPLIILPLVAQPVVAGAWATANRFLQPLVNTAVASLQPILYGRLAAGIRDRDAARTQRTHARWALGLLATSPVVALGVFVVMAWGLPLLGPEWQAVQHVTAAGIIYYVSLYACLPHSQTLLLLGETRLQMVWTVVRFLACALAMASVVLLPAVVALTAWAVASAVTFAWQFVLQRGALRRPATPTPNHSPSPSP